MLASLTVTNIRRLSLKDGITLDFEKIGAALVCEATLEALSPSVAVLHKRVLRTFLLQSVAIREFLLPKEIPSQKETFSIMSKV